MINEHRLRITMEQLGRVLSALEGLQETVLEKNPKLFALMSESYFDLVNRLREEILDMLPQIGSPDMQASIPVNLLSGGAARQDPTAVH
ncbi:MAG: hypothetical protein ACR2FY_05790 [Pirellulaceae bacterium]